MTLSLAYSPCPNDTFIFYAMIHGKVDTEGLDFEVVYGDVAELNQKAKQGTYDITKLSFHALFYLQHHYKLLQTGAALGSNCGPLLIAKKHFELKSIDKATIAIPGNWTTANFLLDFAFPKVGEKKEFIFSKIETAVLNDQVDLGLIIHENRFTYHEKGLIKIMDLGEYWEEQTQLPIPLGCIALNTRFDISLQQKIQRIIQRSLNYAWNHVDETLPYLRNHAQEMDDKVMMQHVNLYVNDFSYELGPKGNTAVERLFKTLRIKQES